MLSIEKNVNFEITINKSRFITYLIKVNNENEINNYLNDLKEKYNDATHHCYAYIIGSTKRFNDDGEPSGTAGIPILSVLENNNLENILCVVIRYFGGIKLGANGLVRAYRRATISCLNKVNIIELVKGKKIIINFNYNVTNTIDYLLKNIEIVNKLFEDTVTYTILISNERYNNLKKELNLYINYIKELKNILIEK